MADPNPDDVMKMVEAELALKRATRGASSSRNAFRIWSLVFIIAAVIGSLVLLEFLVSQIPHTHHTPNPAAQQDAAPK